MLYYVSDIFATCLGYIKILNHVFCMCVRFQIINLGNRTCNSDVVPYRWSHNYNCFVFMPSAVEVGLEQTLYEVQESARSQQVCARATNPPNDQPLPSNFILRARTVELSKDIIRVHMCSTYII